jgi:hypothetical protein
MWYVEKEGLEDMGEEEGFIKDLENEVRKGGMYVLCV